MKVSQADILLYQVACQYMSRDDDKGNKYIDHGWMSAGEDAVDYLVEKGLCDEEGYPLIEPYDDKFTPLCEGVIKGMDI